MTQTVTNHPMYQSLIVEVKREINNFFDRHIQTLEQEFAYKDTDAVKKYLNDGVFAVQYTRFLNRLSNKLKLDLKKYGKEYLNQHYSEHEDYLDVVIRFTKDVDQFYVKQEELAIKDNPFQEEKTDAYVNAMGAGVLTAALTYGLAAFVFKTPFLISTAASGAVGSVVGGKIFKNKLEEMQNQAKKQEKADVIKQVSLGLEESRKKTLNNVDVLIEDFDAMFAKFLKGLNTDAISTK